MSNRFRQTAAGVGLVLCLALFTPPAAQAATRRHTARAESHPSLLSALWSYIVGSNPYGPRPTQGPTVDPNGIS
jgi:hypothetical protein